MAIPDLFQEFLKTRRRIRENSEIRQISKFQSFEDEII
jgi:hypothetical protein